MPRVEAAALRMQTLAEAPTNVTIITAADIRKYGYTTLADVFRSVRGFYVSSDHMYDYVGVRGMSLPGDYNERFLIMINGHPVNENIYNSAGFFEQDFGLDMELVERIEIIRGPTSALYGSNGILANVNVITRSPVDSPRYTASLESGSFGRRKVSATTSQYLGKGVNLLFSASVFNNAGHSMYLSDFDFPETNHGRADRMDADRGYHTFANLIWGNWSVIAYFNSRQVITPYSLYSSIFNDPGNRVLDSRNFVTANYSHGLGREGTLRWSFSYDNYRYHDQFHYSEEDGPASDYRDDNWGDWLTSQLSYSRPLRKVGLLTVGVAGSFELRNLQVYYQNYPERFETLRVDRPDRSAAIFVQQEWNLTPRLTAYLGLRADHSRNFGAFPSPRLALVYMPSARTSWKLVYGHPFRNPSTYEKYYGDPTYQVSNLSLQKETAHAVEAAVERRLSSRLTGVVNGFHYGIGGLIETALLDDGRVQYQNGPGFRTSGVELELYGRPGEWIEVGSSVVIQRAERVASAIPIPNSPGRILKGRAAVPLFARKLCLSGVAQYLSARQTGDGDRVRPVVMADLTASTLRLHPQFDFVFGVRNVLNWRYSDPVDLTIGRLAANGRTFFAKLLWNYRE